MTKFEQVQGGKDKYRNWNDKKSDVSSKAL